MTHVQPALDVYLISYYAYGRKPEIPYEKNIVEKMDEYQEMLMKFFENETPLINEGPSNTFWIESES